MQNGNRPAAAAVWPQLEDLPATVRAIRIINSTIRSPVQRARRPRNNCRDLGGERPIIKTVMPPKPRTGSMHYERAAVCRELNRGMWRESEEKLTTGRAEKAFPQ